MMRFALPRPAAAVATFGLLLAVLLPQQIAASTVRLSDDNFDEKVLARQKELWLVEFFAPWCQHCKKLTPIFEEASKPARNYGMRMGTMDATANSVIPKRYSVKGYPTLIYFRGNKPFKYRGERTKEGFTEFARQMKKPPVAKIGGSGALVSFSKKQPISYLFVQRSEDVKTSSSIFRAFQSAATDLQDTYRFMAFGVVGSADDRIAGSDIGKSQSNQYIVRLEAGEEALLMPDKIFDSGNSSDYRRWFQENQYQTVTPLGRKNFYRTSHSARSQMLVVGIVDPAAGSATARYKRSMARLARRSSSPLQPEVRERFLFGWLDGMEHEEFIQQYGISTAQLPRILVLDAANDRFFINRTLDAPDRHEEFVQAIAAGSAIAQRQGFFGYFDKAWIFFLENYPYSIGAVFGLVLCLVVIGFGCKSCLCDDPDLKLD